MAYQSPTTSPTTTALAAATAADMSQEAQVIIDRAFASTPGRREIATIEHLQGGSYNSSHLITLRDSSRFVLKISPPPDMRVLRCERDVCEAEADVLRMLRSAHPRLPVPDVVCYDDTRTLVDSPYILLTYVPGATLRSLRAQLPPEAADAVEREAASHVRALAAVSSGTAGFGRATRAARRFATWPEAFEALLEAVLSDAENMLVSLPYLELRRQLRRCAPALKEVVVPALAVLDLDDGSVLVDPRGGRVAALIDFERAGWYDPLLCAALLEPSEAFAEGYGREALDAGSARVRRIL